MQNQELDKMFDKNNTLKMAVKRKASEMSLTNNKNDRQKISEELLYTVVD